MIKQKAFTLLETLLALAVGAVLIIVVVKKYQQYQHQIAYEQTKNYLQDIFDYLKATYKLQHCEIKKTKPLIDSNYPIEI